MFCSRNSKFKVTAETNLPLVNSQKLRKLLKRLPQCAWKPSLELLHGELIVMKCKS